MDNRVEVAQLMTAGGPNVKKVAQQALDGSPEDVQEFLDDGWQVAAARDQEALTSRSWPRSPAGRRRRPTS
ncbi:ALF repeat-containing protein [Streptomyces sp. NPDC047049]|uniref:ALF repeat-containing protein n=1 Tax=Streptomyces sp. NPDC047049 TaxID=3156688 RepID=UPI0033EDC1C9